PSPSPSPSSFFLIYEHLRPLPFMHLKFPPTPAQIASLHNAGIAEAYTLTDRSQFDAFYHLVLSSQPHLPLFPLPPLLKSALSLIPRQEFDDAVNMITTRLGDAHRLSFPPPPPIQIPIDHPELPEHDLHLI
ncbi:hypothetical protein PFISCL1PPCAC_24670, partial [Pristionchus fissidentatus]